MTDDEGIVNQRFKINEESEIIFCDYGICRNDFFDNLGKAVFCNSYITMMFSMFALHLLVMMNLTMARCICLPCRLAGKPM